MKLLRLFKTFFYIITTVFLLNIYGVKADECGCLRCQSWETSRAIGTIRDVYSSDNEENDLAKWNQLCLEKYPEYCLQVGKNTYLCDTRWDSMETGSCPVDSCKNKGSL